MQVNTQMGSIAGMVLIGGTGHWNTIEHRLRRTLVLQEEAWAACGRRVTVCCLLFVVWGLLCCGNKEFE
jgi:hypothetical protein